MEYFLAMQIISTIIRILLNCDCSDQIITETSCHADILFQTDIVRKVSDFFCIINRITLNGCNGLVFPEGIHDRIILT